MVVKPAGVNIVCYHACCLLWRIAGQS